MKHEVKFLSAAERRSGYGGGRSKDIKGCVSNEDNSGGSAVDGENSIGSGDTSDTSVAGYVCDDMYDLEATGTRKVTADIY
ncbi:hypothetical protein ACJ73_06241 [Blastomyces percursus]|uniref:Uncharacterized protein n=1 Tax=Blastomyces percursus TaxID=1658174 RepID=A0A1J9QQD0_9EURO|nr:hypothetical protein ACJ73_06241 [Blastomyces percursus]